MEKRNDADCRGALGRGVSKCDRGSSWWEGRLEASRDGSVGELELASR